MSTTIILIIIVVCAWSVAGFGYAMHSTWPESYYSKWAQAAITVGVGPIVWVLYLTSEVKTWSGVLLSCLVSFLLGVATIIAILWL